MIGTFVMLNQDLVIKNMTIQQQLFCFYLYCCIMFCKRCFIVSVTSVWYVTEIYK